MQLARHARVGLTLLHPSLPPHAAILKAVDEGHNINEVEAAGNTPLHAAAYQGWCEGVELLLGLGARIDASNNAGDRPWHWARNMDQTDTMALLTKASLPVVCHDC